MSTATEKTPLTQAAGEKQDEEEKGSTKASGEEKSWDKVKQGAQKYGNQAYQGAKTGAKVTADFTKKQATNVKDFVMDGPVPFRVLAFGGGCAVILGALKDMVEEVIIVDWFQTVASVFNVFFGVLILLLESTAVFQRTPWRKTIYEKAAFLHTTFGRGFLYFFIGTNMSSQNFSFFSFVVGIYVMSLGVVAVLVGYWTQRKLTKLRNALKDEQMVETTFKAVDKDETGTLNQEKFAELCKTLGVPMSKTELFTVFDVIDTSDHNQQKNTITLEEFKTWWSEWDELAEVI